MAEHVGVPKKMMSIRKFSYSFLTYPVMIWLGCWELIGRPRMDIHISEICLTKMLDFSSAAGCLKYVASHPGPWSMYVRTGHQLQGPQSIWSILGENPPGRPSMAPKKKAFADWDYDWSIFACLKSPNRAAFGQSWVPSSRFWTVPTRIFKVSPLGPWAPRYQEDIKGPTNEGSLWETPTYQQS
jgi:hypothetical protein